MNWKAYLVSLLLTCAVGSSPLVAQDSVKARLVNLFSEAEQCYLNDDYQRLNECIGLYQGLMNDNKDELGDSLDVYEAYYYKMRGSYCYGVVEKKSDASTAEYFYKKSLDVFNQRNNTVNALVIHEELAQLYYKAKDYEKAKAELDIVYDYYDGRLNGLGIMSDMPNYYKTISQLAMCNARLGDFTQALEQIDEAIDDYFKKSKGPDYYEALRRKGKILMMQADSQGDTHYKKAVDCYRRYVNERCASVGEELAGKNDSQRAQYWLATHQLLYDCFRLGNHAPEMLYDLVLFSKDYLVRKKASLTKWKQVRDALGRDECAIEFVQYFGKNDEKRLGCLVLKRNSKSPVFMDMFSTDSLLSLPLTLAHNIGSAISTPTGTVKDALYKDKRLPGLMWPEKLMSAIGDSRKVYFSPDGLVHQLAIEYLMPDASKVCYRLSSTRMISQKRKTAKMESALLCGGIAYGAACSPSDHGNDAVAYQYMARNTKTIVNLPGTRREVDSIYVLRNNPHDSLLVGKDATDEAFIRLLKNKFDVIHLSTHGFYGDNVGIGNDIKPLADDHSMSKSGLLFAGAEATLANRSFDENMSDGVLSSLEIAKQDLSASELVILSACQSGQGKLTSDGVYGLQRGLKLAGANAMIVSLWCVNDHATSLLMRFFYEELEKQKTKDIHEAFLTARRRLMEEKRSSIQMDPSTFMMKEETVSLNEPHYTNPFIIIDAF